MRVHYEIANFLIASWRLATAGDKLPTSHGILDRALERVQSDLPSRFRHELTFSDTPIGRLCVQLPDILRAAQESYLTSDPNPTYKTAQVKIQPTTAMSLLDDLDIDIAAATDFGERLAAEVKGEIASLHTHRAA